MYAINYDDRIILECKVVESYIDDGVDVYVISFWDNECEMSSEAYAVYDTYEAAKCELDRSIEYDMSSSNYTNGYAYACGYYD